MSIQSSHDPFHDMTEVVRKFLVVPGGDPQKGSFYNDDQFKKQVAVHLSHFILNFGNQADLKPQMCHVKNLLAMKKWMNLTILCQRIGISPFSHLTDSEVNHLFLGDGICVGAVIQHFSQFFMTNSPLSTSFPMAVDEPLSASGVTFHRFNVEENSLVEQTRQFRFLQAAYRVAYGVKTTQSLEFVPHQVLRSNHLEFTRRIPDFKEPKLAFLMQDFLPQLKQLAGDHREGKRGYLLGINAGSTRHSIAVCLQPPYHFMDLRHGIAIADDLETLILFLANYLILQYPKSFAFALLELSPLSLADESADLSSIKSVE